MTPCHQVSIISGVITEGTHILVESRISLRDGLQPNDFARREAHDHVEVGGALGGHVDVVAQAVGLCEEHLGEIVLLRSS